MFLPFHLFVRRIKTTRSSDAFASTQNVKLICLNKLTMTGNQLLCNGQMLLVFPVSGKCPCPKVQLIVQRFFVCELYGWMEVLRNSVKSKS